MTHVAIIRVSSFIMATKLLIVESPAKCKKIQSILGNDWRVIATMGHIRCLKEDLAAIGLNVSAEKQMWKPTYISISSKSDAIASLRQAVKTKTKTGHIEVYLGSDDDREGEAIAWHTCQILKLDPASTHRVVFHEITDHALKHAVAHPGIIDMNKLFAQEARSMLDLLIGFTLSPCLWRSVEFKPGLSVGRCQSPMLRLVYDREREINAFAESISWKIQCYTSPSPSQNLIWISNIQTDKKEAIEILTHLNNSLSLTITHRTDSVSTSAPSAPFITSTLQQEASNRLSMNPKITMKVAQKLYELGHITYMRTDNPEMSEEAVEQASDYVISQWGADFVFVDKGKGKGKGKGKKDGGGESKSKAHEAIRPTHFDFISDNDLSEQENKLYRLIWKRSIQSVMARETRDVVKLTGVLDLVREYETSCNRVTFQGFRIIDQEDEEKNIDKKSAFQTVSGLSVGTTLQWEKVTATEVRTSPPTMYTEASLINVLEKKGIGRPSTYASLIETVLERGYVEKITIKPTSVEIQGFERISKQTEIVVTVRTENVGGENGKLHTTPLGITVIRWLLETFEDMIEYDYTAHLETQLDLVSKGEIDYSVVLDDAWKQIESRYKKIMSSSSSSSLSSPSSTKNKNELGEGYKCIQSKKGLLFVHESELPTQFASVPSNLTIQTATLQDAKIAFTTNTNMGDVDGDAVIRKMGPIGLYVTWKGRTMSCKDDDTLDTLIPKLRELMNSVDHCVGPFKIKSGPYGLYMFKCQGQGQGKGKPKFVSIPSDTSYTTLTIEGADTLYKHCCSIKKGKRG